MGFGGHGSGAGDEHGDEAIRWTRRLVIGAR